MPGACTETSASTAPEGGQVCAGKAPTFQSPRTAGIASGQPAEGPGPQAGQVCHASQGEGSGFCLYQCWRFYRVKKAGPPLPPHLRKGRIWIRNSPVATNRTQGSRSQEVTLSKPIHGETSGNSVTRPPEAPEAGLHAQWLAAERGEAQKPPTCPGVPADVKSKGTGLPERQWRWEGGDRAALLPNCHSRWVSQVTRT